MEQNKLPEKKSERCSVKAPLEKVWEFEAGGNIGPRIVADDMVFIGCEDKRLYALDATSGQPKWESELGTKVSTFGIVRVDNTVYAFCENSVLYAIDTQTGKIRWQFAPSILSPFVVANETAFIVSRIRKEVNLCAVDTRTGSERWRFTTKETVFCPAVHDDTVFFATGDKRIYALDVNNGETRWESVSKHKDFSRPAIAKGRVLITGDSTLCAFDASTGAMIWELKDAGHIAGTDEPTIIGDHILLPNNLALVDLETGAEKTRLAPGTSQSIDRVEEAIVYTGCTGGTVCARDLATGELQWYAIIETKPPGYYGWDKSEEFVFAAAPFSQVSFGFTTSRVTKRWYFPEEVGGAIPWVAGETVVMFPTTLASNKRKVRGYTSSKNPGQQALLEIGDTIAESPEYVAPVALAAFKKGFLTDTGQFAWPEYCCLCLGPAEKRVNLKETIDKFRLLVDGVPYCANCYKNTMKGLLKKEKPGVKIISTNPPVFVFRNERYWAMFMEANRAR